MVGVYADVFLLPINPEDENLAKAASDNTRCCLRLLIL